MTQSLCTRNIRNRIFAFEKASPERIRSQHVKLDQVHQIRRSDPFESDPNGVDDMSRRQKKKVPKRQGSWFRLVTPPNL